MTPATMTTKQHLVDVLIQAGAGQTLAEYVDERRAAGISWRLIADEVRSETGVDVTFETLRIWFTATEAA